MGASGAGKTSLMFALANRSTDGTVVEGDILINGRQIGDYMRYISGFMHQEDLFIDFLTVWEHMNVMARLKLDRRTSSTERKEKVLRIMRNLSLLKCKNKKIGNMLSGGEKKRLAFATELLTDPPLLFCDEPTTGLDSYSSQKLVTMMNLMASSGKTILCTIHQPSSQIYKMFTQVILLANGRIAYMGSTSAASDFFESLGYTIPSNYNPADFYIRTLAVTPGSEDVSKQAIRRICDHFAVSDYAREIDIIVQYEFHMGRAMQGLALIIAVCFKGSLGMNQAGIQATQGILFTFVTENTFSPMYSALETFPIDRPLFLREYKSGLYSPGIYYVSKILAMLPGLIIEPTLFVTIAYLYAGLRQGGNSFLMTAITIIVTTNVATACGIMFSNAFESVPSAFSFLVPFDYILLITSGLFIKLSTLPVVISWTKYLSWLMYSMESLTILQWDGVHNITCEYANSEIPCTTEGEKVLEKYNFSSENFLRDLLNMAILCLCFHVCAFLFLWRRTRK